MTVLGVLGLNRGLFILPPVIVSGVPINGVLEAGPEVGVFWLPAELGPQFSGINSVTQVVTRAVLDLIVDILRLTHQLQDHFKDFLVVLLDVGPDQVSLTNLPIGQDVPDGARVIVGVDPVPDVLTRAIELRPNTTQDVSNLPRDEFFDMLVWTIVIRAVGDRRPQAKRTNPGPGKQVRASLG